VALVRAELARAGAALGALGPSATLARGYAIVRDQDGHVVLDASSQPLGSLIEVRLALGALDARVEAVRDSRP
jgi:exodeoxyribonuclease VII large subunit